MSCTCHCCGRKYKVDLIVPDKIWREIAPVQEGQDAGLLCGPCVAERLEELGYDYWYLTKSEKAFQ
jgi:hypothetical protein